jgi:hypothetical protein
MINIKNTPYNFYLIRRVDIFKKNTWDYEIGLFRPDSMFPDLAPMYIGVYRPAFQDYLLINPANPATDWYGAADEASEANAVEATLNFLASVESQDEVFTLMNNMLDYLNYHPVLKDTPMQITTNDSQYNLLGALMSVNNRLLLGGRGIVELDNTSTPWTIAAMPTGDKMSKIIKFHEELIKQGLKLAGEKAVFSVQ